MQETSGVVSVLRAIAGAANALRLYPETSPLPAEAVGRAVTSANELTGAMGPVRVVVEPHSFTWSETSIGDGNAQIEALAESLYAHQAGSLVIAPDLGENELRTFLRLVDMDKSQVKDLGGLRAALSDSGVDNLAVIEVSLRASEKDGLSGVDLLTASLDDIANEVVGAVSRWEAGIDASGTGLDEAADAFGGLEMATREIAASRVTEALLRLDEETRVRVLAGARRQDSSGKSMEGMLKIISQMNPAALSRLLTLAASGRESESPLSVLGELDLPADLLAELTSILSPSPQSDLQRGVPEDPDIAGTVEAMAHSAIEEEFELERQIKESAPSLAAGRALAASAFLVVAKAEEDGIRALGDAMGPALAAGAFGTVSQALTVLDEVGADPALAVAAERAAQSLKDVSLLREGCSRIDRTIQPEQVAHVLASAGEVGYETFLHCWVEADGNLRNSLAPVLPLLGDRLIVTVGREAKGAVGEAARDLIDLIARVGDRRSIPVLAHLARHSERPVRVAALAAVADAGGPEAAKVLSVSFSHPDTQTRIAAVREIARGSITEAVPALVATINRKSIFERDTAFKMEVIDCVVALGAVEATPALKKMARRGVSFGAGNRQLEIAAQRAVQRLES